jgi:mono/diheme cytochrome c family protein
MKRENLQLQLLNAVKRLMIVLFLLVCSVSTLVLMSVYKKPNPNIEKATISVAKTLNPTLKLGKTLFLNNCAQCHAKDMTTKLTGPALKGVQNRWQDDAALYDWITKGTVPERKMSYISDLKRSYNNFLMPQFSQFKDNEVKALLAYIDSF